MKKFVFLLFSVLTFFSLSFSAYAASFQVYGDLAPSSSRVEDLISYAQSDSKFFGSDFVVFRSSGNNYQIVYGDLTEENSIITGTDVSYILYSYSNSSVSSYSKGTYDNFSLNSNGFISVSNIDGYGFSSDVYDQFRTDHYILGFLILLTAFCFCIFLFSGSKRSHI